jgi:hypothetical protein
MTILRSSGDTEIWCRCDAGPLGFSSTAAHGHDDALSVELRHDGVDLLADPGTYCYQSEPFWRSYFRSIRAHNTLELAKARHSRQTGAFIWTSSDRSGVPEPSDGASWSGYCIRPHVDGGEIEHRRSVFIDDGRVTVEDQVDRATSAISRFHLGPLIECVLEGHVAILTWEADGQAHSATMELAMAMTWRAVRGDEHQPIGWFSPTYDVRLPSFTLEGLGEIGPGQIVETRLVFEPAWTSTPPEARL